MSEWIWGCQDTFCIFKSMQSVSWHIRIHSDKPLYSSYLILKRLHITLHYSKSSPLCQCHNRKLSPYFKIILKAEIPIISLHPQLAHVFALSSLASCWPGFLNEESTPAYIDPCAWGGGAVCTFERVKQRCWQQVAFPCLSRAERSQPLPLGVKLCFHRTLLEPSPRCWYVLSCLLCLSRECFVIAFAHCTSHLSEVAGPLEEASRWHKGH